MEKIKLQEKYLNLCLDYSLLIEYISGKGLINDFHIFKEIKLKNNKVTK